MNEAQSDPRPSDLKKQMALHFHLNEAEYRDSDWCNFVYEDDQVVLIEDHDGAEWGKWLNEVDDEVSFSSAMHNLASQLADRRWPSSWPIVFDKLEVADNDCPCCGGRVAQIGTAEGDIWDCTECYRQYDRSAHEGDDDDV